MSYREIVCIENDEKQSMREVKIIETGDGMALAVNIYKHGGLYMQFVAYTNEVKLIRPDTAVNYAPGQLAGPQATDEVALPGTFLEAEKVG